ncbi:N-acetylmuramoyl-L-alanine amidase [Deinococcus ruber]|uniref:N-acetylmuramoyl-L-alanine amidase n=2 Tax=Deinococcus ruber TaxID=1848197 RepID=A0A918F2D5_9DEIO|nr:N-acetylmuramoyl-L-alanine amidase [Deinococcus ruber]
MPAFAAPRLGGHDTYTRLVFDLPAASTARTAFSSGSGGNTVLTITLQVPLKTERGNLLEPGVASYATAGKTVTLQLASGSKTASVTVLPASGGQPNRLVIDVPFAPAKAGSTPAATTPGGTATPRVPAPPRQPPAPVKVAAPVLTVVLDAGHGGVDSGMVSRWVTEKDVTLDVAMRVRGYLTQRGVKVIMVRSRDTQLSTDKRTDLEARSRLARAGTVNAYISIHVNSGDSSADGIETYYFGSTLNTSNRSLAVQENGGGSIGQQLTRQASGTAQSLVGDLLAQAKLSFSAQLAKSVQSQLIGMTGATNRGVQSDAFYVIRNPTVPAILTEIGFGSSPDEGPKLAQAGYRDRVAGAIATGILKFLKVN